MNGPQVAFILGGFALLIPTVAMGRLLNNQANQRDRMAPGNDLAG